MRLHTCRPLRLAMLVTFVITMAIAAQAQEAAAPQGLRVAVVSLARIEREYTTLRAQEESLGQWLRERRSLHEELANYVFLSSEAFQEVMSIIQKPRPLSEQDQARLEELRAISDEKDRRYGELRAKTDRTPAENEEFASLQEIYEARLNDINQSWKQSMSELDDRRQTAVAGLMATVQEAIKAEAEAAGYTLVLDADAVFFGGDDITAAVIARLNSEAGGGQQPAEGGGQQPAESGGQQPAESGGQSEGTGAQNGNGGAGAENGGQQGGEGGGQ